MSSDILSRSPRELIFAAIENSADDGGRSLLSLIDRLSEVYDTSVIREAFRDAIESMSGDHQLMACGTAMSAFRGSDLAILASRKLHDRLLEGALDDRLMAAYYFFNRGAATEEMIGPLRSLLRLVPRDDNRHLWVAGAIVCSKTQGKVEYEVPEAEAMYLLDQGLRSDDWYSVVMAAMAFGRLQIRQKEVRARILGILPELEDEARAVCLSETIRCGVYSPEIAESVFSMIRDVSVDPQFRYLCVIGLARTPADDSQILEVLLDVAFDSNWQVASVAFNAIGTKYGTFPDKAIDRLVKLLSHPERDFRGMAAVHLSGVGEQVRTAVPTLLDRLLVEQDEMVLSAILRAIGCSGRLALPALAKAVQEAPLAAKPLLGAALLEIGTRNAADLSELFDSPDSEIRQFAAVFLHSLGPGALPLVPLLEKRLLSKDTAEVGDALIGLSNLGSHGRSALPTLIGLLTHQDGSIRDWAAAVIMKIGLDAIPVLEEALRCIEPSSKSQIAALLERLRAAARLTRARIEEGFEGVSRQGDLELFLAVGKIIRQRGGLSYRTLAEDCERLKLAGELPDDLPTSEAQIRTVLRRMEAEISAAAGVTIYLVERAKKNRGGLTPDGAGFLDRLEQYFDRGR